MRERAVVVCTVLVIVLPKVIKLGRAVDKLSLLEFVQHMTDIGCILRIDDEEIEDVRKKLHAANNPAAIAVIAKNAEPSTDHSFVSSACTAA
jgi:hypothetical protein